MNINLDEFKATIKQYFYDKTITRYSTVDTVDAEGWARKAGTTVTNGTFLANVHFNNFDKIQKEFGITEGIDIVFSTDSNEPLLEIVGYLGRQYEIFRVIPNDSHYLLIGRKWLSRSSTSISV